MLRPEASASDPAGAGAEAGSEAILKIRYLTEAAKLLLMQDLLLEQEQAM